MSADRDWTLPSPTIRGKCEICGGGPDDWCEATCTAEHPHWPPLVESWATSANIRRAAEVLYDELAGRHTGDPDGPNAALAAVRLRPREQWDKREEEVYRVLLAADALGLDVHWKCGDRWGLALRLAEKVLKTLDEDRKANGRTPEGSATSDAGTPR